MAARTGGTDVSRVSDTSRAAWRSVLESREVFTDRERFLDALEAPADDGLARLLGTDRGRPLIYVAQQVCADYQPTAVVKFAAARDLAASGRTAAALLWHDMDRAGSEKLAMRFVVTFGSKRVGIMLAPRSFKDREPRFIPVDRPRLDAAIDELGRWLANMLPRAELPDASARLEQLATALRAREIRTLAEANRALASCLLREQLGFVAPSAFVSELVAAGLLTERMNSLLQSLHDVISAFNEAIRELRAAGVDPGVRQLDPDYLPVRYACPRDGCRIPLTRIPDREGRVAVGRCRCGVEHRFELGDGTSSLGELGSTGRWSPDLTLPILLNDLASGVVAGRSSARYGLVLNEVVARALGERPIPMHLPAQLAYGGGAENQHDDGEAGALPSRGLLADYLLR